MKEKENHPWLEMEKNIKQRAEEAKRKWGFPHLRNATKLVYDIGEEVYYVLGSSVYKGKIVRVLPFGGCWVTHSKGEHILLNMKSLYKNVRYALVQADYNRKDETIKEEEKDAQQ